MRKLIRKGYDKVIGPIIPRYAVFSLIFCFVLNSAIYTGTQIIMAGAKHYDFTTDFDRVVPLVPQFIYIYLVCYAFWVINYILAAREGRKEWFHFVTADMITRLVCGLFFIVIPTTNIRPEVVGSGWSCDLLRLIYEIDPATNLFPSIHCLVSWLCYVGIRKSKKVPRWYRIFSCVFAMLVFASTQFTKQHYFVDIIGALIIAEGCYYLVGKMKVRFTVEKIFDSFDRKVFGGEQS